MNHKIKHEKNNQNRSEIRDSFALENVENIDALEAAYNMDPIVRFRNVSKQYSEFALNGVSFDIPRGFITGFIGPNGSGKTTSIKAMLSLIHTDGGMIEVFGKDTNKNKSYAQQIGVVMDAAFLVKDWKVKDIRKSIAPLYDAWDEAAFTSHLQRFKINDSLKISELSRGMTVKLMLAIALSHDAKLLVLDEPTSGLDPSAREEICEILQDYMKDEERSIFFSTHITSDLEAIADYITFILDGNIIYSGTKDALIEQYVLVKGGLEELAHIERAKLIGLKKSTTFFEAIAEKDWAEKMLQGVDSVLVEPVSLEQLIIFFNREGRDA